MANPLNGCTIVLTRDAAGLAALATPLMARGAKLVQLPAVVIAALPASAASDALLARVSDAAWLACTSGHGARAFAALWDRLARPWPTTVRLAAVGPSTAAIMTALLGPVDLVPQPHRASALAAALSGRQRGGGCILWPRGNLAAPDFAIQLRAAAVEVVEAVVYCTRPAPPTAPAWDLPPQVDLVVFSSPSAVQGFCAGAAWPTGARAVSIGPSTSAALRQHGIAVVREAQPHTLTGLLAAIDAVLAGSAGD